MFKPHKIYIQISRNKVTVVNLETGIEVTRIASEPFSSHRSVLSSFSPANETLLAALKDLNIKTTWLKAKAVIQQMEDTDGGLTDIEKRALSHLAENAGAGEVYIANGSQRLTNAEVLAKIEGSKSVFKKRKRKSKFLRRGYVFAFFSSLIISGLSSLKYHFFERNELLRNDYKILVASWSVMFISMFIVTVLIARWYYQMKDN